MREAPSLVILPALVENGALIRATDPKGIAEARSHLPESIEFVDDVYETLDGADAVVVLTEWNAYRGLDLAEVRRRMRGRAFIDLRNVLRTGTGTCPGVRLHVRRARTKRKTSPAGSEKRRSPFVRTRRPTPGGRAHSQWRK